MFSVPDILVVSVLALLLFGPDRLPSMMRQAGRFMREIQNTSQSFVAEMERAADFNERPEPPPPTPLQSAREARAVAEPPEREEPVVQDDGPAAQAVVEEEPPAQAPAAPAPRRPELI